MSINADFVVDKVDSLMWKEDSAFDPLSSFHEVVEIETFAVVVAHAADAAAFKNQLSLKQTTNQ